MQYNQLRLTCYSAHLSLLINLILLEMVWMGGNVGSDSVSCGAKNKDNTMRRMADDDKLIRLWFSVLLQNDDGGDGGKSEQ